MKWKNVVYMYLVKIRYHVYLIDNLTSYASLSGSVHTYTCIYIDCILDN